MNIKIIILAAIAVMLVGCDDESSKKVTPKEKETKAVVIEKPETPKTEVVFKEVTAPSQTKTLVVPSQPEKKVELSSEELKTLFLTAKRSAVENI